MSVQGQVLFFVGRGDVLASVSLDHGGPSAAVTASRGTVSDLRVVIDWHDQQDFAAFIKACMKTMREWRQHDDRSATERVRELGNGNVEVGPFLLSVTRHEAVPAGRPTLGDPMSTPAEPAFYEVDAVAWRHVDYAEHWGDAEAAWKRWEQENEERAFFEIMEAGQ